MSVAGEHEPDPTLRRALVISELVGVFDRGIDVPAQAPDLLMSVVAGTVQSNEVRHVGEPVDIKIACFRDGENRYFHVNLESKDGVRKGVYVYNTMHPTRGRTTSNDDGNMQDYLRYAAFTEDETRAFAAEVEGLSLVETGDDFTLGDHPIMAQLTTEVRRELTPKTSEGSMITRGLHRVLAFFRRQTGPTDTAA